MSLEDDADDRPYRDYSDLLPIGLALLLTVCGIGMFFFHFTIGDSAPPPQPPTAMHLEPGEVMIGVGQGSAIHPVPPRNPDAHPTQPAPPQHP